MTRYRAVSVALAALLAVAASSSMGAGGGKKAMKAGGQGLLGASAINRQNIASPAYQKLMKDTAAARRAQRMHQNEARLEAARRQGPMPARPRRQGISVQAAGATGGVPNYFGPEPNWAWTPAIPKFVDQLPQLNLANGLGQQIPLATKTVLADGSEYYEIGLVETTEQMSSSLGRTTLREYVQLNGPNTGAIPAAAPGVDASTWPMPPHYLGPVILGTKGTAVRVLFRNLLPLVANGGNLGVPVDTTVMGAGTGPLMGTENYTQNRATLHLHGGKTPWISDGTPHQWTAPAGEATSYPRGVSTAFVPDMWFNPTTHVFTGVGATPPNVGDINDPGPGAMTFYYPNQQSARMLFYHDHAWGITRLNVYVGEAAGYLITDATEQALIAAGTLPDLGTPLVIQDKTFIDPATVKVTDPTWPFPIVAGHNDLWYPHVWMPNQNPAALTGVSPVGRWDYGPWFWPPWPVQVQPVLLAGQMDPVTGNQMYAPAVPDLSQVMEAMGDTMVVNGTAFPYMNVDPKPYRFRVLSVGNDRFLNLSTWIADPANPTEVRTVPATKFAMMYPAGWLDANGVLIPPLTPVVFPPEWTANDANGQPGDILDGRASGVPDPMLQGPPIIQIGTEGGFLPSPVILSPQMPVGFDRDVKSVTVGNVKEHNLYLGPAERADILIDFSAFVGKTIILYNDSPAPLPATDARLDYYTGNADMTATGGRATTLAGMGPNTRTVMAFKVSGAAPVALDKAKLQDAFAHTALHPSVFEASQEPIIVPQGVSGATFNGMASGGYDSAYGKTFPVGFSAFVRLGDTSFTLKPLDLTQAAGISATPLTIPLQPKAIAEEFEDTLGRMSAFLGHEVKFTNGTNQTTMWYNYRDPQSDVMVSPDPTVSVNPLAMAADGTEIWKVTHNGVDTHVIHFHLFDVQIVNRVGWDGTVRPAEPNELGWKDSVRMNPLEDCIVAARPRVPNLPFDVPNSWRTFDPAMPPGVATMTDTAYVNGGLVGFVEGFKNVDPNGNPVVPAMLNTSANFGMEYVWHCHLLAHEEMDMMRPNSIAFVKAPTGLTATVSSTGNVTLTWTNGKAATWATVQRALDPQFTVGVTNFSVGLVSSTIDKSAKKGTAYLYRVMNNNTVGSGVAGFPTAMSSSGWSNVAGVNLPAAPPTAPTTLVGTLIAGPAVTLTFTDTAANEGGFYLLRSAGGAAPVLIASLPALAGTGVVTYTDKTVAGPQTYVYNVQAWNAAGTSTFATSNAVVVPAPPAGPLNPVVSAVNAGNRDNVTLSWAASAGPSLTGYTIQRATNAAFTTGLATYTGIGLVTTWTQTGVPRTTNYYYRIQAVGLGGASAWVNATPSPILTP